MVRPSYRACQRVTAIASIIIATCTLAAAGSPPAMPAEEVDLWIAESAGTIGVATSTAAISQQIPVQTGARAVATDPERDTIWSLSQGALLAHDRSGGQLAQIGLSGPQGQPAALEVDAPTGGVWLAVQSQVSGYNAIGQALFELRLSKPFGAATLDSNRSRFWYSVDNQISAIDVAGQPRATVRLADVGAIQALTYSATLDQLWVVADGTLRRVGADGVSAGGVASNSDFRRVSAITADAGSGAWAIADEWLMKINQAGEVTLRVRPSGSPPDKLVDVVASASDGSVWVATSRKVLHVSEDGAVVATVELSPAAGKTRLIQSMFLQGGAPRIQFSAPAVGAYVAQSRPTLQVTYSGARVDPASLQFSADGRSLAVNCSTTATSASCVPLTDLADGTHAVSVTIANQSGQRSRPAEIMFVVDTVVPAIQVFSPAAGFLTNAASVTVSGKVSEIASVTVRGTNAPLDASMRFTLVAGLDEGLNYLPIEATDRAGNRASVSVSGLRDSTPPQPPAVERMRAQVGANGIAHVVGAAGAAEPGSLVTLVNVRTGSRVTVTAGVDGRFEADIAAQSGDEIRLTATDSAGNGSASSTIVVKAQPGFEPLRVSIIAPTNGAVVQGSKTLVTLALEGPANSGVIVNGYAAEPVQTSAGLRAYAVVPVTPGVNNITAIATAPDGRTDTRSISVSANQASAFEVLATPAGDVLPVNVRLQIGDPNQLGIRQVAVDVDSNGTIDQVSSDPLEPIKFTYQGAPGLRQAQVTIIDGSGRQFRETVYVVVLDPQLLDRAIKSVWSEFNAALLANDRARALKTVTFESQRLYGPVFEALMPHMADILDDMTDIERQTVRSDSASYLVLNVLGTNASVHVVQFIRSSDGVWRLESL